MRDEFAWHNKILPNLLWFICLFVKVNEMAKAYEDFFELEKFGESAKPCGKCFKAM